MRLTENEIHKLYNFTDCRDVMSVLSTIAEAEHKATLKWVVEDLRKLDHFVWSQFYETKEEFIDVIQNIQDEITGKIDEYSKLLEEK